MSGVSHPSLGHAAVAAERGRLSSTVGVRAEGQGHSPRSRCQSDVERERERRPIGFDMRMYVRTVAAAGFVFDGEDGE